MAVTPQERQLLLDQLNQQASSSLAALWQGAAGAAGFAAFMVDAFPELAVAYSGVAADMAATWFEMSAPASTYIAVPATIPVERLSKTAQWALGASGDDGLARLDGSLQRAVYDGARETIVLNVQNTGSRWIRVTDANPCSFCRLLATRKNAYRAKNTAATKVHDQCGCQPVEVRGDQDWTELVDQDYLNTVQEWETQYLKARADAGSGDPKKVLASWRQLVPDAR